MNIQLFLEGQEVELTNNISFPLNRSYENLYNPTDILVEYSKSVEIPITSKNNKILGHAYRLDKAVYSSDNANIGLYLNPLKRIPFQLFYNNSLLLDGYAKFVSANKSVEKSVYTLNLVGKLGDIFHELKSVITSESKLGDLDSKYLITKADYLDTTEDQYFNANFANRSFTTDNPKFWDHTTTNNLYYHTDVFGLAPAHRGLYPNFESNKIQTNGTTMMELSEYLTNKWKTVNPDYNIVGAADIVGDGFKDYQMREFRSYQLKPYMYFSHLMKIFVNKCKLLTDYSIELDRDWFNFNNPYWSRLCYMFDYLDNVNSTVQSGVLTHFANGNNTNILSDYTETESSCSILYNPVSLNGDRRGDNGIIIAPFDVKFGCNVTVNNAIPNGVIGINDLNILPDTFYKVSISVYRKTAFANVNTLVSTYNFWTAENSDIDTGTDEYSKDNFIELSEKTISSNVDNRLSKTVKYTLNIPQIPVSGIFEYGALIKVDVSIENRVESGLFSCESTLVAGGILFPSTAKIGPKNTIYFGEGQVLEASFSIDVNNLYTIENWKTQTPISLETIWQKDTPLFDIILEYTKMFALHWDIDYINKKINLRTRKNMFKDYTIEDWNDKIDKSKDFIIEPISFSDRYAVFNYKDVEGYIFSNYRNKYGVNIGEKRINTGYEFNTTEKDLFKDINPTSVSSKSYISIDQFINWDAKSILNPQIEEFVLLDYETVDEKNSISLNNWCFRGANINPENLNIYITDDTPLMLTNKTSCYIDKEYLLSTGVYYKPNNGIPQFTNACDFYGTYLLDDKNVMGMVFNRPSEDYTYNSIVTKIGDNDIYNQFWKDYIYERYNSNNKKVTAYVILTLQDFNSFTFNKFVTIDNQLFMINKIIDFNIEKGGSTKVELVQLQDTSNLTSKTFRDRAIIKRISNSGVVIKAYGLPLFNMVSYTGNIEQYLTGSDIEMNTTSVERYLYFDFKGGISGDVIMENELGEQQIISINF